MLVTEKTKISPTTTILHREFEKRCKINPRFSLRGFAKTLKLSPSHLSLLLSQKRRLSPKTAGSVSERLGLDPHEKSLLMLEAQGSSYWPADSEVEQMVLDIDTFSLIADWKHYAILNLLNIPETKYEPRWIANRLGVSEMEASIAMQRLTRLGLVKEIDGQWKRCKPIHYENNKSTAATRQFHRKLLEKAIESLESDPFEVREVSSITFSMDPELIPYARERIRMFRRILAEELSSIKEPKEVYNLTVQIYPVTVKGEKS